MAIRLNADDFWEFSLALYCREAVANACLSLQDRRGADVNLILAICWLARCGYALGEPGIESALEAAQPWSDAIIKPLRQVRRRLRDEFGEVSSVDRQSIKHGILSVELEAERTAQRKIAAAVADHVGALSAEAPRALAAASLEIYLGKLVPVLDEQDFVDRETILGAL